MARRQDARDWSDAASIIETAGRMARAAGARFAGSRTSRREAMDDLAKEMGFSVPWREVEPEEFRLAMERAFDRGSRRG